MHIKPNEIQIWSAELTLDPAQEAEQLHMLSQDEQERALRFRFPIHKTRFIATRCLLRKILGDYLGVAPQTISFAYTEHQKPYLLSPENTQLQFNVSNSDDLGLFAFTLDHAIGVDIEKVQDVYKQAVAERFFSPQENAELSRLPSLEQINGFYRIWSRKEALVKAVGKGLTIPLTSFSVSVRDAPQMVELEEVIWQLIPLRVHTGYESAVASSQLIKLVSIFNYYNNNGHLVSEMAI
jgi:4'-phosphopantetheinyl transferase